MKNHVFVKKGIRLDEGDPEALITEIRSACDGLKLVRYEGNTDWGLELVISGWYPKA